MSVIVDRLRDNHRLSADEYRSLLEGEDQDPELQAEALKASTREFGKSIFVRGLIEISNHCRNNCYYCGIRAGNASVRRYRLSSGEILECCRSGYARGFRTFVLQGGEDPALSDEWLTDLIREIKTVYSGCAVTLSLGERPAESYAMLRKAGADRYLLRHETRNPDHYRQLHPSSMSLENRLECLGILKGLGYQTGSGMMVGSPYQTTSNLVEDLMYLQELKPEMVGVGPFIHHAGTPLGNHRDGSVGMTLKLISILRLMNPRALIPATTALATLDPDGRKKGILAGANVVMPNLTPSVRRGEYEIYEGKASTGAESAEGLEELKQELKSIGYGISVSRGDYMN